MLDEATPTRQAAEATGWFLTMRAGAQGERKSARPSPHGHDDWHHLDQRRRQTCAMPRHKENSCLRNRPTASDANDGPSSLALPTACCTTLKLSRERRLADASRLERLVRSRALAGHTADRSQRQEPPA